MQNAECVLVPGGFGDRGVGGMILAAKYARENNIPYLGICLGMQISVIEFARSVLGLKRANSNEFDSETPNPVVIFMPEGSRTHMGSTMRLGSRRTLFQTPDCVTSKLYVMIIFFSLERTSRYMLLYIQLNNLLSFIVVICLQQWMLVPRVITFIYQLTNLVVRMVTKLLFLHLVLPFAQQLAGSW